MQEFFPSYRFNRDLAKLTAERVIIAVNSGEHCQRPTPDADGTKIDIYAIQITILNILSMQKIHFHHRLSFQKQNPEQEALAAILFYKERPMPYLPPTE